MKNARNLPQLSGVVLEELTGLTLVELSRACSVHADCIVELVDEGVLAPVGGNSHHWRFNGIHLRRARVALRLQSDLGVNLAGAALAIQLIEELETLRSEIRVRGRR